MVETALHINSEGEKMAVCRSKGRQASPAHVTVDHAGRSLTEPLCLNDQQITMLTSISHLSLAFLVHKNFQASANLS